MPVAALEALGRVLRDRSDSRDRAMTELADKAAAKLDRATPRLAESELEAVTVEIAAERPRRAGIGGEHYPLSSLARTVLRKCRVGTDRRIDSEGGLAAFRPTGAERYCRIGPLQSAAVPIYEYVCMECETHFEELVRDGETPVCPDCSAANVRRKFSSFATKGLVGRASCASRPGGCGGCSGCS